MHVKAGRVAFGGLMLAVTVLCMYLGSVIESSTLFLLAAASFFVGIIIRESGLTSGIAFYIAGVILGFFVAPNKLYVVTYAAMGLYIWLAEGAYQMIGKLCHSEKKKIWFWVIKYIAFNVMYIPILIFFQQLLFGRKLSGMVFAGVIIGGQIGLFVFDRSYEYFQRHVWSRFRGRIQGLH